MGLKHLPKPEEMRVAGTSLYNVTREFHTYDEVPKRSKLSQEELERLKRMVRESPILVEDEHPGETVMTAKAPKITEKIRGKINVFMANRRAKKRVKEMDRQKIGSVIYEIERNRNNERNNNEKENL